MLAIIGWMIKVFWPALVVGLLGICIFGLNDSSKDQDNERRFWDMNNDYKD